MSVLLALVVSLPGQAVAASPAENAYYRALVRYQACLMFQSSTAGGQPDLCDVDAAWGRRRLSPPLCTESGCSLPKLDVTVPWISAGPSQTRPQRAPLREPAPLPPFRPIVPQVIKLDSQGHVVEPER